MRMKAVKLEIMIEMTQVIFKLQAAVIEAGTFQIQIRKANKCMNIDNAEASKAIQAIQLYKLYIRSDGKASDNWMIRLTLFSRIPDFWMIHIRVILQALNFRMIRIGMCESDIRK